MSETKHSNHYKLTHMKPLIRIIQLDLNGLSIQIKGKFCKNLMHFGNCLSLQKAEYLKNNVVIWSHWLLVKNETSGNEAGLLA